MRAVIASLLLALPSVALAQTPAAQPTATAAQPTATAALPAARRGVTPYTRAILDGIEAHRRRDWDGAMNHFRQAATLEPRSAEPTLYMGFTAAARGEAATALGSFREAARVATAADNHRDRARALAAIATLHETQARWDDAVTAWQEYVTFADAHADVTYGAVGRARVDAIRRRASMDQSYEAVRHRIAERQRLNASGANSQPPPPSLPASAITR